MIVKRKSLGELSSYQSQEILVLLFFCFNSPIQDTTRSCTGNHKILRSLLIKTKTINQYANPTKLRRLLPVSYNKSYYNSLLLLQLLQLVAWNGKFQTYFVNIWTYSSYKWTPELFSWTFWHPSFSDWVPSFSAAECCNYSHHKENLLPVLQLLSSWLCNCWRSYLTVSFGSSCCS